MRPVVIDFETFYSDDFTLKKLSTEHYVRDSRFVAHGAAIKWAPDTAARWYDERQLRYLLAQEDWSDTFLIAWHAQFDGLILTHHYNVHPKMWGCPMSMARMIHGSSQSVALDAIRKLYHMPKKSTPYDLFRGRYWNEMTSDVQDQVARGAEDEVESIWTLFARFAKEFPVEEYGIIDSVVRMFVDPVLQADVAMLGQVWADERDAKAQRMAALELTDDSNLQSADRFIELLEAEGVEIEYKQGKKKPIPCFAKNDEFMQGLLEHPNERIRTLAEARIGAKSTLLQTRAETLGWMARRGPLCVYLRYCGAGTGRVSGGDSANWLNFKRGSSIRRSITAPDGFLLAPIDSSQIECRVLHYLAGGIDEPVIQKFRNGEDPYVDIASEFYQEKIYKPSPDDPRKADMEAKRGMGKQSRLMCLSVSTPVLTDNGVKELQHVEMQDRLWDGTQWVVHDGFAYSGLKECICIGRDVWLTPGHLIWWRDEFTPPNSEPGWMTARLCQDVNLLPRYLATGDIINAGPRHRFTILFGEKEILVHNCGYGAAGKQFRATARAGTYGPPVDISLEDANAFVALYRKDNPSVCAKNTGYWAQCEKMLGYLADGATIEWGPLTVKNHKIYLPNGCFMVYDSLEYHYPDAGEDVRDFERAGYWRLKTKNGWKKMWGSKLTQNICEFVSRVIVSQAMLRIKELGFRTLNWPYDELLLLIPDDSKAEDNVQLCTVEMKRVPDWLPGIPLDCESSLGKRYLK
jgi:hypothetical protein